MEQGSTEWLAARAGSLGASQVADAIARTKSGWGASRANVMATLITERLTGKPVETYTNAAMAWGTQTEPDARAAYEFMRDVDVELVGIVKHPTIVGSHASPDGLVGDKGLIEIKCPQSSTHIETLLTGTIPGKYITQMQWQMACTGREFCDHISYDPRLPTSMQLWIKRVERDDKCISELEEQVQEFLHELDAKVKALRDKYEPMEQAA
jgi:putative phage-type endonuclease